MFSNAFDRNSSRLGRPVVLLLAATSVFLIAGGSAAAAKPKEVTVVGPVTVEGEVDVRRLDNPALTAFQSSGTVNVTEGFVGVFGPPIAEVPEGTRLVVEYASVLCDTPAGNSVGSASLSVTERTSSGGTISRSFQIPLNDQGAGGFSDSNFVGGLSTRLYADRGLGGIGVSGGVLRASGSGDTNCFFSISGHTVPLDSSSGTLSTQAARAAGTMSMQELILPYTGRLPKEALQPPDGTVVKLLAP